MPTSLELAPTPRWRIILDAVPLSAALLFGACWIATNYVAPARALTVIGGQSAPALEAVFERTDYVWPPNGPVPRLAVRRLPPDMASLSVDSRKAVFFSSLTPLILAENARLERQRARLEDLLSAQPWSVAERRRLSRLAEAYSVSGDLDDPLIQQRLLDRVDAIPVGLALAQAAKESGWGTSRFAQQGRNLFGVWTWDADEGMVPRGREAGEAHLVRVFPSLRASVRNYLHTLNTGAAYLSLRELRARFRAAGVRPKALPLTAGLARYSQRGEAYVREVRAMIRGNELHQLGELSLAK